MKEKRMVPELRFPEFQNDWIKKELSELFSNSREKGYSELPIYSVSQKLGLVPRNSMDRIIQKDADAEDNLLVKPGYLAYNMMRMWQGAVGLATNTCMVSPAYVVLKPKKEVNSEYFIHFFERKRSKYLFTAYSYGLTLDRLRLYYKDFSVIKIYLPSFLEQKKIASFLTSIDKLITLLTQKKEKLEQYKKGVMQKIFNQETRFKDENGKDFPDWKLKKLGELFDHRSERGIDNMELLSVTISEGVRRQIEINKRDNSNEDKSNYKKVFTGDIVYNSMRMWQGAVGVSKFNGIVSPAYTILKGNHNGNSDFFVYLFKTKKMLQIFQRNSQGLTSDTWNLKYPQIALIEVRIPILLEQQKIASFLSAIDKQIENENKQIALMKQWKKGLLQKMFV